MYRPAMHTLYQAVAAAGAAANAGSGEAASTQRQRLLLTGQSGSGKSIALVGLVEWARQHGWLVLYVPSCVALIRGGYFSRRPGPGGGVDTLTSAQQLLKGLVDSHGPQLKRLPVKAGLGEEEEEAARARAEDRVKAAREAVPDAAPEAAEAAAAETLYDVAAYGLSRDDDAAAAVEAVRSLVRQLIAASSDPAKPQRVLFALDDYNCLYGATDYGELASTPQLARRRVLHSDELILARSMRLLDEPNLGGAVVAAATLSTPPLPAPKGHQPRGVPYTELPLARYTEAETCNALAHYAAMGHAPALATSSQARQLHALTQGNARELREMAATLGLRLK
ncbi:hypothetical protein GPECTOR_1g482 [Gonium pectorale]|uniref:Small ribosomal subunit protein mS29 n=1 Tax=Gonium pectorale TaxID=33097 RepID=A0A150H2Y3_GONPE|nr:hypothetical protein GPECTOR_1g482 [Gonium pectorale]|eukprot:KXZ56537.1 hypothetical protein GPECTOR_1g482 [Gonium pectorale]